MSEKSEYNRGKRSATQYFSKFRSFTTDNQGRIVGNKKSGSTEVIGKLSRETKGFYGGWASAERAIIKSKQVKTRKPTSPFGVSIKMPSFKF